ncbi:CCA tRNA nucleotidyltransferase, mitochondrial, partial [Perkinsus chesapeaki]
PTITFQDDPLRILRAVRFATRLGFKLDNEIVKAASNPHIYGLLLTKVSRERWGVEVHKMLVRRATSLDSLDMLASLGIINVLTTVGEPAKFEEPTSGPECQGTMVRTLVKRLREVEPDHPLTDDQHYALTLAILTAGVYGLHVREKPNKPPRCACYGVLRHGLKLPNADAERASAISEVASGLSTWSEEQLSSPVFVGHFMRYLKDDWVVALCLAECLAPISDRQRYVNCRQNAIQSGLVGCWDWRAPVNGASLVNDFGMPRGEGLSALLEIQIDRLLSQCSMAVQDPEEFKSWLQGQVDEWIAANPEAVARANKSGKSKKSKKWPSSFSLTLLQALEEVTDPASRGVVVRTCRATNDISTDLLVVQGGACDFYEIALSQPPPMTVVLSIRAPMGVVTVIPDSMHFTDSDYDVPRRIVVRAKSVDAPGASDNSDELGYDLLHYVTSKFRAMDGISFRLKHRVSKPGEVISLPSKAVIIDLGGGDGHSVALLGNGTVYSWGDGSQGQLGYPVDGAALGMHAGSKVLEGRRYVDVPRRVEGILGECYIVSVACGANHTLVLSLDGQAFAFGRPDHGQLGFGPIGRSSRCSDPVRVDVPGRPRLTSIAAGGDMSAAIDSSGLLHTWGRGIFGALGHGTETNMWTPHQVDLEERVLAISLGTTHSALLTHSGAVMTCGSGEDGRLGFGTLKDCRRFVKVESIKVARLVCCGGSHTGVIDSDLNVLMWGSNSHGQLGLTSAINGDIHSHSTGRRSFREARPQVVEFFRGRGVCGLQLGHCHSLAITLHGVAYAWGDNSSGQLGIDSGGDTCEPLPRAIDNLLHAAVVRVGRGARDHSLLVSLFDRGCHSGQKLKTWKLELLGSDEAARAKANALFRASRRPIQPPFGRPACGRPGRRSLKLDRVGIPSRLLGADSTRSSVRPVSPVDPPLTSEEPTSLAASDSDWEYCDSSEEEQLSTASATENAMSATSMEQRGSLPARRSHLALTDRFPRFDSHRLRAMQGKKPRMSVRASIMAALASPYR